MSTIPNGDSQEAQDQWFEAARIVDPDWVELDVTTAVGKKVQYLFPRRTYFTVIEVDQAERQASQLSQGVGR